MTGDHARPRLPAAWASPGVISRIPKSPMAHPTSEYEEYESLPTMSVVDPRRLFARDGTTTNGQAPGAWTVENIVNTEVGVTKTSSSGTFGLPGQPKTTPAVQPRPKVLRQDDTNQSIPSQGRPALVYTSYSAHHRALSSPPHASLRDIVQPPLPDLTSKMGDDYLDHPAGKGKVFPIPEHRPECQPPTSMTKRVANNLQKFAARSPTVSETSVGARLGPVSLKSRDAVTRGPDQASPDDKRTRMPKKMRTTIDMKEVDSGSRTLQPDYFIPMPREDTDDESDVWQARISQPIGANVQDRDEEPAKSNTAPVTPRRPVRSPLRRAPPPPVSTIIQSPSAPRPVSIATSVISHESLSLEDDDTLPDLYPFSYTEDDDGADQMVVSRHPSLVPQTKAEADTGMIRTSDSDLSPHITAAHRSLAEYSDLQSYFDIPLPNALPPPPLPRTHEATATAKKRYGIATLKWHYEMEVVGFQTWARDRTDVARRLSKMQGILEEEQPDPVNNGGGDQYAQSEGHLYAESRAGWEDMPDFDIDLNEGISNFDNRRDTAQPTAQPRSAATVTAKEAATDISRDEAIDWTSRGASGLQVGLIAPSQYIGPRGEHRAQPRIDHDRGRAPFSRSSHSGQDGVRATRRYTGSSAISQSTTTESRLDPAGRHTDHPGPARLLDNGNRIPVSAHRQDTKYSHVNSVPIATGNDSVPDVFFDGTLRRIFEASTVGFDVPPFNATEKAIMRLRRDLIIRDAQLHAIEIAKHKLYKRNAELMSVLKDVQNRISAGTSTETGGACSLTGSLTNDPMFEIRQALDRWWKQQARRLNSQWQKINQSIHVLAEEYATLAGQLETRHTSKVSSRSAIAQSSSMMRNLARIAAYDHQVVELIGLDIVSHKIKNWGRKLVDYSPVRLSKRDKTDEHSVEARRLCGLAMQKILELERDGVMVAGSTRDLVRVMEVAEWAISELDLEVKMEVVRSSSARSPGSSSNCGEGHRRRPSTSALARVSVNLLSRSISRDPKATSASLAKSFKSLAATMRGTMHESKPIQSIGRLVSGIQSSADLISDLGKGMGRSQQDTRNTEHDGHNVVFAEGKTPMAPMPLRRQRRRASLGGSAILQTAFLSEFRYATHNQNETSENPMTLSVTPRRLEDNFDLNSSTGNADADTTPRPAARSDDEANEHYASQKSSGSSQSPVTPSAMSSHGYHPYFDNPSPDLGAEPAESSPAHHPSQSTSTEEASLNPLFLSQQARRVKPKRVQRPQTGAQAPAATLAPPTPARVEMWDQPQYQPEVWAPNDGRGRECF